VQTQQVTDFQRIELGAIDEWRNHYGGFKPTTSRDGRRVVDHEVDMQYIGVTANSYQPGEEAGYWHSHSQLEELYVFLTGRGEMGLDDEVVPVGPGTAIRVGQGVMRTWRAVPDTREPLTWLCIRAGGVELEHYPSDATRDDERPSPWRV
jgi:mannose-6-phosphate isomerase-like protein (cupin superfamily)